MKRVAKNVGNTPRVAKDLRDTSQPIASLLTTAQTEMTRDEIERVEKRLAEIIQERTDDSLSSGSKSEPSDDLLRLRRLLLSLKLERENVHFIDAEFSFLLSSAAASLSAVLSLSKFHWRPISLAILVPTVLLAIFLAFGIYLRARWRALSRSIQGHIEKNMEALER